ncbi:MAG: hypothetical protein C4329_06530 [Chitinophagaceae bacterium]|mgnify:FL=1
MAIFWHVIVLLLGIKLKIMATVLNRLNAALKKINEKSHTGLTVALVLMFLAYGCVSFIVLVNSYA